MEAALSSFAVPDTTVNEQLNDVVFIIVKAATPPSTTSEQFSLNLKDLKTMCYMVGIKSKIAPAVSIIIAQELIKKTIGGVALDDTLKSQPILHRLSFETFAEVSFEALSVNSRAPFDLRSLTPFWDKECENILSQQSHPRMEALERIARQSSLATPLSLPSNESTNETSQHSLNRDATCSASNFSAPETSPLGINSHATKRPSQSSIAFDAFSVLIMAIMRILCKHTALIVLCGGTSGTGKTTLASLLAARLGIRTIVSTDSLREAMRDEVRRVAKSEGGVSQAEKKYAELFVSTYEAANGPNVAAVMDKIRQQNDQIKQTSTTGETNNKGMKQDSPAVIGHMLQSALVKPALLTFIKSLIRRRESAVIEGVHLTGELMEKIAAEINLSMASCPNSSGMPPRAFVIPSLIYIEKEDSHQQRFAVRVKDMSQDPVFNKYIRQFHNIRAIQDELVKGTIERQIAFLEDTRKKQFKQEELPASLSPFRFFPIVRILNSNLDRSVMRLHVHTLKILEMITFAASVRDVSSRIAAGNLHSPSPSTHHTLKVLLQKLSRECLYNVYKKAIKHSGNAATPSSDIEADTDISDGGGTYSNTDSPQKSEKRHHNSLVHLFSIKDEVRGETSPMLVPTSGHYGLASLSSKDSLQLIHFKNAQKIQSSSCQFTTDKIPE